MVIPEQPNRCKAPSVGRPQPADERVVARKWKVEKTSVGY
jgi:hypothetical protein